MGSTSNVSFTDMGVGALVDSFFHSSSSFGVSNLSFSQPMDQADFRMLGIDDNLLDVQCECIYLPNTRLPIWLSSILLKEHTAFLHTNLSLLFRHTGKRNESPQAENPSPEQPCTAPKLIF